MKNQLNETIADLINKEKEKFNDEMNMFKREQNERTANLMSAEKEKMNAEIAELKRKQSEELNLLKEEKDRQIWEQESSFTQQINNLRDSFNQALNQQNELIVKLKNEKKCKIIRCPFRNESNLNLKSVNLYNIGKGSNSEAYGVYDNRTNTTMCKKIFMNNDDQNAFKNTKSMIQEFEADVYSFGVVVFFIFFRALPKQSLNDKIACKMICLPINSNKMTKIGLNIVKKCLDLQPANRPSFEKILNEMRSRSFEIAPDIKCSLLISKDMELLLI